MTRARIAVIGSGVAGLVAGRSLARHCHVTVLDKRTRPGGHVRTIDVQAGGKTVSVDTGFIVFNEGTYPHFSRLLGELDVASRPTNMSFSVRTPDLEYGSATLSSFFADRRNLLNPAHYRLLGSILTFLRRAQRDLGSEQARTLSLPDYLSHIGSPASITDAFAVPLASALWSMAPRLARGLPAETFLRFLAQHGMLRPLFPPKWRTVVGGSRSYLRALLASSPMELMLGTRVVRVRRDADAVHVDLDGHESLSFDGVVLAVHTDQALSLIEEPTAAEADVLGGFTYSDNHIWLHTEESVLPRRAAARASWNYDASEPSAATVTYWMNRLQGIAGPTQYCVTVNPGDTVRSDTVIDKTVLRHPIHDVSSLAAQPRLGQLQGTRRTYFCGAYFGFGFHEDGVRAGLAAAARCIADTRIASAVGTSP